MKKKHLLSIVISLSIGIQSFWAQGTFHTSGNNDIDAIRKEIKSSPTTPENYRTRSLLLYLWMGALQQQGADLRPFYEVDNKYYALEPKIVRGKGEEKEQALKDMSAMVDEGYAVMETIQTKLSKDGTWYTPFESDGKDFPEGGDMNADWPMFQGNKHNNGHTTAPGPKFGKQAWKFPVGLGWYCRPVIEDNRVYVASPGMYTTSFCFDLETGKEIWKSTQEHPLLGIYKYPAIMSSPVIQGDKIIYREVNSHGGNKGQAKNLVYIDKKTGKTLARKFAGHIDYRTQNAPVATNGEYVVYPFGVHDIYAYPAVCQNLNRLICADKDNNYKKWDFNVGDIDALAEPVLSETKVYQGTTEGYLYALNLAGGWQDERIAWHYKTNGSVNSSVTLKDGKVYVGSNGGSIYCFNAETGDMVWETKVDKVEKNARKHFTTVEISGTVAYVGSANKMVYALDIASGKILWKYQAADWVRSKPVVSKKQVMFADVMGSVYAISKKGKLIWKKKISSHPIYADPSISNGKVVINDSHLGIFCINLKGDVLWEQSNLYAFKNKDGERIFTDVLSGGTYYQSKPTAADGKLYFGNPAGFLYSVDAETGKELWKFEMGAAISVGPAIADGKVYSGQQGGERFFYCNDANTGELIWKQALPGGWVWGSAAVDDGMVYIPTVNGHAVCLDGKTGHIVWMYPTAMSVPAEPAIDGDLVYFGSWSRSLYAFNKKTGEIIWKSNGVGLDSGTLIAEKGKIYLPHHHNIFTYFDAKNGDILCPGNLNEEEKGPYSNFNASPAFANGKGFFTARSGVGLRGVPVHTNVFCVDAETAKIHWTFPDGGGLSAPALANGRLYIGSANTPFFYCLNQEDGKVNWIYKLGNRIEESTLCIYRDKIYALAGDGYVHAVK